MINSCFDATHSFVSIRSKYLPSFQRSVLLNLGIYVRISLVKNLWHGKPREKELNYQRNSDKWNASVYFMWPIITANKQQMEFLCCAAGQLFVFLEIFRSRWSFLSITNDFVIQRNEREQGRQHFTAALPCFLLFMMFDKTFTTKRVFFFLIISMK